MYNNMNYFFNNNKRKTIKTKRGDRIKPVIGSTLILLVLLFSFIFSGCLNPEPSQKGGVDGYVYRETMEGTVPLADALISVTGSEQTALTDNQGYYQLTQVPVGSHVLTVSKEGYVTKTVNDIIVTENETIRVSNIITSLSSEEELYNQAKDAYVKGDYNSAIVYFQEFIDTFSESKYTDECQFFLASSYYSLDYFEQAITEYNELLLSYSQSSYADDAQYFIAYCYENKLFLYSKALVNYYALLTDFPDSKWVDESQLGMGNCYYANSEYDSAIEEYNKFIADYPDSPYLDLGYLYLGNSYRMLGGADNYQQAILTYQEIINSCPDTPYCQVAYYYTALTYYNMKEYEQSINEFENLIALYPDSEWPDDSGRLIAPCAQYYIAWCYESGLEEYINAIAAYQQVIDLYPNSTWADGRLIPAEATFQIGQCYRKQGEIEPDDVTQEELMLDAIAAYQQVIDLYPNSTWADGSLIVEDAQAWIDWIQDNYL